MKLKRFLAATGAALLLTATLPVTAASHSPLLSINGAVLGNEAMAALWGDTTYASLRTVSEALDDTAVVSWLNGAARVQTNSTTLCARPGDKYVTVNNQNISVPQGVKLVDNRILIPVRTLAQAFGATVCWNPATKSVSLTYNKPEKTPSYTADDLYWLSRIISAESRGEPMEGKIAVGNVVLNRVASPDFPDTIYGVIFDERWGGQFEPVRNGTIYQPPTAESIEAAKRCLEGTNIVGNSLYFFAPSLAQNFWIAQNREYVTTIGCHDFYL